MEFKQLEAFVAVVDYGSFSEAARKLYLTQPTISAHVRSLEEELHTKLILRTTKKTTITTRGYQLYDSAVRMLEIRNSPLTCFLKSWQPSAKHTRISIFIRFRQTAPNPSTVSLTER